MRLIGEKLPTENLTYVEYFRVVVDSVGFAAEDLGLVERQPLWWPAISQPFVGTADRDAVPVLVAGNGEIK